MAKTWTEELPVMLTEAELLERGEALALQEQLWREVDDDRKEAADAFKAHLAKVEGEQARLARIVRDKQEPRPVVVRESRDFTENRVDVVRTDTGEVIRTRVMSEHERQLELMPKIEPTVTVAVEITKAEAEAISEAAEADEASA